MEGIEYGSYICLTHEFEDATMYNKDRLWSLLLYEQS